MTWDLLTNLDRVAFGIIGILGCACSIWMWIKIINHVTKDDRE